MLTAGKLAKKLALSRIALLYYDSLGLLQPTTRSAANYREYSDEDVERLRTICTLRKAGLRLKDIGRVLRLCRQFLEFLCVPDAQIEAIRARARRAAQATVDAPSRVYPPRPKRRRP